jgi:hypothetical protein
MALIPAAVLLACALTLVGALLSSTTVLFAGIAVAGVAVVSWLAGLRQHDHWREFRR